MFVVSMKASRKRLFPVLLCIVLIIAMLIAGLFFPASRTMMTVAPVSGDSDEACAAYLTSLGFSASLPAVSVREITFPAVFDETLNAYNALQSEAGFDLSGYAGQRVKYRTYTLNDHPSGVATTAHIYVYNGRIIGGDIAADDGSFTLPLCEAENGAC